MALIFTLPSSNRNAGLYQIPAVNIPTGTSKAKFSILRNSWGNDGQIVVEYTIYFSGDGGATWPVWIGDKLLGGIYIGRDGNPVAASTGSIDLASLPVPSLADTANTQRRVKADITLNVTLNTGALIELN